VSYLRLVHREPAVDGASFSIVPHVLVNLHAYAREEREREEERESDPKRTPFGPISLSNKHRFFSLLYSLPKVIYLVTEIIWNRKRVPV
jgi:hypothetical protein